MTKRFGLLVLMIAGLLCLPAAALEIKTGFGGGATLSSLTGGDAAMVDDSINAISNIGQLTIDQRPRHIGLSGSVALCVEFNEWVALLSELSFAQKGSVWKGNANIAKIIGGVTDTVSSTVEVERRLNYIELPVMAAFKPHFGALSPFVFAGPCVSFNCFAEEAVRLDGRLSKERDIKYLTYGTVKNDLLVYDVGYCAGAGIGYTVLGRELTLDGRVGGGLVNIIKDKNIKVSTIAVRLGILVPR